MDRNDFARPDLIDDETLFDPVPPACPQDRFAWTCIGLCAVVVFYFAAQLARPFLGGL